MIAWPGWTCANAAARTGSAAATACACTCESCAALRTGPQNNAVISNAKTIRERIGNMECPPALKHQYHLFNIRVGDGLLLRLFRRWSDSGRGIADRD